ncbi:hypothetical protein OCL06_16020 [Alteromonas sp. ASW11-19]|uniref:Uncharacterized protein n=1 Tax=Alteromonas salexigens TaxID=2982530 RepID=A0ABT2VRZ8_9ALTE|nr:hypothetical protein [Alteromonas salexigens]MCU7556099.1 hypothetical protein [Alteromonas salexigens]
MNLDKPHSWVLPADENNATISVAGFGEVTIERGGNGLHVRVFDLIDDQPLGAVEVRYEAAYPAYERAVSTAIIGLQPQEVDSAFIMQQYEKQHTPAEAMCHWYQQRPLNITRLIPLAGTFVDYLTGDNDFTPPFIPLQEEHRKALMLTQADFFLAPGGRVVSYGYQDNRPVLMPARTSLHNRLVADNSRKLDKLDKAGQRSDNREEKE